MFFFHLSTSSCSFSPGKISDAPGTEAPVFGVHPDEMRQLLGVGLDGLRLHTIDPQIGATHPWPRIWCGNVVPPQLCLLV